MNIRFLFLVLNTHIYPNGNSRIRENIAFIFFIICFDSEFFYCLSFLVIFIFVILIKISICYSRPGTTAICSDVGQCECGVCKCDNIQSNRERFYSGQYCQCNDYSCDIINGQICGGKSHQRYLSFLQVNTYVKIYAKISNVSSENK